MKYPKSVAAALAETHSKFALAEALANEIPPENGRGNTTVTDALIAARDEIIEAGGEPRSVSTLERYRATARWVAENRTGSGTVFAWVPGVSFTSHREAMEAGTSLAAFSADPKTAREVRADEGKASKDGDPVGIVKGWSEEQRIAAARELHHDPDVADELARDQTAKDEHMAALLRTSDSGMKEEAFTPEREREGVFWTLQSKVSSIVASLAALSTYLTALRNDPRMRNLASDERETLRGFAANLRGAADKLDVLADTESMDAALTRILDEAGHE
jgi:hypothetical protein